MGAVLAWFGAAAYGVEPRHIRSDRFLRAARFFQQPVRQPSCLISLRRLANVNLSCLVEIPTPWKRPLDACFHHLDVGTKCAIR